MILYFTQSQNNRKILFSFFNWNIKNWYKYLDCDDINTPQSEKIPEKTAIHRGFVNFFFFFFFSLLPSMETLRKILEHVFMTPEVNSNLLEISNCFEKLFRLHDKFTTAILEISNPFQKLFCLHANFAAATF